MSDVVYALSEEKYTLGKECRISYGIVVYSCAEADGTSSIIASVHDITPNKEKIAKLVDNYCMLVRPLACSTILHRSNNN